jgi:hypothetical protein
MRLVLLLPTMQAPARQVPEWLDHEGVELVITGAAREPGRELGMELDPQADQVHDAHLFRDLRIRPGDLPVEPMRSGKLR